MPAKINDEVRGHAERMYRTTNMSFEEIANATGVAESTIRGWCKKSRWQKDMGKVTASRVRNAVATGTSEYLSDYESDLASEMRAAQISDYMEQSMLNAGAALNRVAKMIPNADTGQSLKALVETNHKATVTIRDVAGLDEDNGGEVSVDALIEELSSQASEGRAKAEQEFNRADIRH